jgi:hypothetical protein
MGFSSDPALLANQLPISVEFPKDFDRFLPILDLLYKRIANSVNTKEGGLYSKTEVAAFMQYFTSNPNEFRPVYRKVIDFGALPNAGIKQVAHGLTVTNTFRWVRIYGAATDPVALTGISLDRSSPTLNENIKVDVDATNVTITTAINYSAYTSSQVVLEYTKIP